MRFKFGPLALALLVALCATGCDSMTAPGKLVPGLIDGFEDNDPIVTLEVQGTSLDVELRSYGNGCREKGELRMDVSEGPRTISISVYDRLDSRYGVCDDMLRIFEHAATIEVDRTGPWTVEVIGQDISRSAVKKEYTVHVPA